MLHVLILRDEVCPSCAELRGELEALQSEFPHMQIGERLLTNEPEIVGELGIVATPALVVNSQLAFQGVPDLSMLRTYLRNAEAGLHDDPDSYPPEDERDPENVGQEALGSMDTVWRGSGRGGAFDATRGE
jgi:hypothetical protein